MERVAEASKPAVRKNIWGVQVLVGECLPSWGCLWGSLWLVLRIRDLLVTVTGSFNLDIFSLFSSVFNQI